MGSLQKFATKLYSDVILTEETNGHLHSGSYTSSDGGHTHTNISDMYYWDDAYSDYDNLTFAGDEEGYRKEETTYTGYNGSHVHNYSLSSGG